MRIPLDTAQRRRRVKGEVSDVEKAQVQAYCSEYQATMTRMNWFMSLQFLPLAPLVALLTLVAVHTSYIALYDGRIDDGVVTELGALGVQVTMYIYCFSLHEVYNHALYIESHLKPKVAAL